MNGEELEELFVETGENQAYNQINLLRRLITRNKQVKNSKVENISFDTPVRFSVEEVLNAIVNFPFKKYYSIKVVSDSLSNNEYNNFNYKKSLDKIIKVIDKII